ncbi:MAG: PD-(D/E)XK nuclease family protein, partial [Anaerovoracaceae bacterium]
KKRRFDDIFRMLKTGFGPAADSECEELEKYCRKYNIRSGRWKSDFVYGIKDEGEDTLLRLNGIRQRVDDFLRAAEQLFEGAETVRQRCEALYCFLTETARMPQILAEMQPDLEARGLLEEAEMTGQMWDTIVQILDQMVEVLGDATLSHEEFNEILQEGFEEVELGLLPTNNDQVIFGTMQRTRMGEVKVLFVAGANDGVLPESGRAESLLSDEEKQLIAEQQGRISRTRELRDMEQGLAMYKNLTKASRQLIVSYAELDTDGTVLRPSELAEELRRHAGTDGHGRAVQLRRDYISAGDTDALLQTASAAAGHVTAAMRRHLEGEPLEDRFRAAALALDGHPGFDMAKKGLYFSTPEEKISRKQVKELFGRGMDQSLILSTSAFERYSRCPFSFFIMYGIRPEEERRFTVDMRSIGDIYHECMRRTAQELTREGMEITAPDSPWMTVTREECRRMTGKFVDEFADRYREGILKLTGREAYIRERIREICFETAWLMIQQVQRGRIRAIYFEQRFGKRSDAAFPPVILHPEGEEDVYIEGIIDRVDVIRGWSSPEESLLFDRESVPSGGDVEAAAAPAAQNAGEESGSEQDYIRIIDYKSGNEKFDLEEVRSGWRLQLMVYLKGAMGAVHNARPAGVFYFAVKEPRVDVSGVSEDAVADTVEAGLLKGVKLDGAVLDNASVIEGMDADMEGYSEIIPVYHRKDGTFSGTNLLSPEDFGCLMEETDRNLLELAADFASGRMDPDPKSGKYQDACRYCSYTSICCRGVSASAK